MRRRPRSHEAGALVLVLLATAGCAGSHGSAKAPADAKASKGDACAAVLGQVAGFGDILEEASADARTRAVNYAGLLGLLLSVDVASGELDRQLGALRVEGDLAPKVKAARGSLGAASELARSETAAVEKHAREVAPLAKETQAAWTSLRALCEPKRAPSDCASIREVASHFDAADSATRHEKVLAELAALRLSTPAVARARDRAVTSTKAVEAAVKTRADAGAQMPKKWSVVQKDLGTSIDALVGACKTEAPAASIVAAEHPDPRKLTVLVHVKPPAGVERSLLSLAKASHDDDEKAFYTGRAEGAFGSGFLVVKKTEKGNDVLVVTNRHVVELGDRAALELADGTSLGPAEVVYAHPTHDLAVLRPAGRISVTEGFAFARTPAKDQQTVIATGFPGMVGRPSYQTTRGYVSNESFRLDDGTRPLTYVQHTAPIDPGSSGGPLTDESGKVLGVNTMKVTGREAVGLAVPSVYVLETLRAAGLAETQVSRAVRLRAARLACLDFVGELGAAEPRPIVLEQMISNRLVEREGLDDAMALGGEEDFEDLWNSDSVRAMRIAALVRLRAVMLAGGGPSMLETCEDAARTTPAGPNQAPDVVEYRIRLGNFETRALTLRWEQGRFKVDALQGQVAASAAAKPAKKLPPPAAPPSGKKLTPPKRP